MPHSSPDHSFKEQSLSPPECPELDRMHDDINLIYDVTITSIIKDLGAAEYDIIDAIGRIYPDPCDCDHPILNAVTDALQALKDV